jgi:hypothetical protein
MRRISLVLLTAALLGAATSDADDSASAKSKATPDGTCFLISEFQSWKAPPDAKSIFIRVDHKRYLRLELASACPMLTWPDARLITKWHGPNVACDALDWDLSVSQGPPGGFPVPCIVKKVHPMTPEEVAALPKNQRP